MAKAVEAYEAEQAKSSSQKGACTIAREHGIQNQWRTIVDRDDGGRSICDVHKDQQKLSSAEEATLVDFFHQSTVCGFPQTHQNITQYANLICQNHLGSNCEEVGDTWVVQFLDQHHDNLQTLWSKPLDTQRAQAMNSEAKRKWFELLQEFVVKVGIQPEELYGMDETDCPPSD